MTPPRPSAATERGEETRRRLLELAAAAIADRGYLGLSLNDLIRQSGLTKGAFYFHFPSKEALALEVYRYKQEQWAARVMDIAMREPRAIDKITRLVFALVETHENDPGVRMVQRMCTELGSDPHFSARFTPFLEGWVDLMVSLLHAAQSEGDVRADLDLRATAEICVAAFIGMQEVSQVVSAGGDMRRRVSDFLALLLPAITTKQELR